MSREQRLPPDPAHLAPIVGSPGAQEASLKRIYDTAPIGLAFLSPDCRYLQINQRLTEICGIPVEGHLDRTVRECVPGLGDGVEEIVRTILRTGEPVGGVEVAGQRPGDESRRSWMTYWHPVHGADGEIIGVNVAAEEITERKRAEAALKASEQQFRTLADSMPQLVWMSGPDGAIFWFNDRLAEFAAVPADAIAGMDWVPALAADPAREHWEECRAGGWPFGMELVLRRRDGSQRTFLTRIIPLRDAEDVLYRWIGTHIDISEQKEREDHVRFVADELAHRTKNLLTVVMAFARQIARQAESVEDYQERFADRVAALAHSHELLVRDHWLGAPFSDLVATQLRPFEEAGHSRIDADGPPLVLRPKAVQYIGLAMHELATNASKHGALSGLEGEVSIRWVVDAKTGTVRLSWQECNGPIVVPPRRHGFGHVVIEQIVPRALNGNGGLGFLPEGVSWWFEFPCEESEAGSTTDGTPP